jgi:hypothetical protein
MTSSKACPAAALDAAGLDADGLELRSTRGLFRRPCMGAATRAPPVSSLARTLWGASFLDDVPAEHVTPVQLDLLGLGGP